MVCGAEWWCVKEKLCVKKGWRRGGVEEVLGRGVVQGVRGIGEISGKFSQLKLSYIIRLHRAHQKSAKSIPNKLDIQIQSKDTYTEMVQTKLKKENCEEKHTEFIEQFEVLGNVQEEQLQRVGPIRYYLFQSN